MLTVVYSDAIFRDTKKSHNAQLRAACETALQEIQELVGTEPLRDPDTTSISSVLPEPYPESARLDADKYFLPFRLVGCCQTIIIMPFFPQLGLSVKNSAPGCDFSGWNPETNSIWPPDW